MCQDSGEQSRALVPSCFIKLSTKVNLGDGRNGIYGLSLNNPTLGYKFNELVLF